VASAEVRTALARELHDRVAQALTSILVDLEVFKREQAGQDTVLTRVDSVQGSMREVLSSLRELLNDLRTEPGGSGSVFADLPGLVGDFVRRTGIETKLVVQPGWPAETRPAAAYNLYRIAEEALMNARRHGGATQVRVELAPVGEGDLRMTITDDGRGFEAHGTTDGMGTIGMRERAVLMGARLRIDSVPGGGTSVKVTLPRSALAGGHA
jgi:two-component system sensor histidine kinase UhpB